MKVFYSAMKVIFLMSLLMVLSWPGLMKFSLADEGDLVWSTFVGGSGLDNGYDIAIDRAGTVWIAGCTESEDFPTTSGAFDTLVTGRDAFVTRLDPTGSTVLLSTLLGGNGWDECYSLALDGLDRVTIAGFTSSVDFPTTPGAFDSTLGGGSDAFVARLDSSGSLLSATFLGGSGDDQCFRIATDDAGRVTAIGNTGSSDFPFPPGSIDETLGGASDAFVVRLSPDGGALEYGTFLGGSSNEYGWGIALDGSGKAYVTGYTYSLNFPTTPGAFDSTHMGPTEVFVACIDSTGSSLCYATLLGGGFRDQARSIAVDSAGCTYVTGYTRSTDFPITPGAFQDSMGFFDNSAFVTKLNPMGSSLVYSTFLNGDGDESGYGIALDDSGCAWIVGFTDSEDFPVTSGSFDESHNGQRDIFICQLNSTGTDLRYSTYVGGTQGDYAWDLVVGEDGHLVFAGYSQSTDYPVISGAFQEDLAGLDDVVVASLVPGSQVPVVQEPGPVPVPDGFILCQNWPNPFNSCTRVDFWLPHAVRISLAVYNVAGQRVRQLAQGRFSSGDHTVIWDGRDEEGREVSSGAYFCRLEGGEMPAMIKMMLLR